MFAPIVDKLTLEFEQKNEDRKRIISKLLPLKGENLNNYTKTTLYTIYREAEAYNNDLMRHGANKGFGFYIDHLKEFFK